MTRELTAAEIDAQADEVLEQMEATGWQADEANQPASADAEEGAASETAQEQAGEQKGNEQKPVDGVDDKKPEELDLEALEAIANGGDGPVLPAAADPLNFNVNAPADYKTARATLLTEKTEAWAKVMAGEMDASEYTAIESRVLDDLEELSAQRIRAETLQEVNIQSAAQSQKAIIQSLIERTADVVPYATDAKAQRQFDMAMGSLSADPDMVGKSFAELASEAHKVVLALRGVQEKPKAQEVAPERKAPKPPVTLSGLPNAGDSGERSVTQILAGLSGPDFDRAFDALPKDQQQKYLKQA